MEERTAFRTCPFCEATCGLAVTVRGDEVVKVRGDGDDVFSRGFLCPKGVALQDLHEDPDRLRTPLLRGADGELRPVQQRRVDEHETLGRNDPCWCGSGKKFKKCHGA